MDWYENMVFYIVGEMYAPYVHEAMKSLCWYIGVTGTHSVRYDISVRAVVLLSVQVGYILLCLHHTLCASDSTSS